MTIAVATAFELGVAVATASPRFHDSQDRSAPLAGDGAAQVVVCDGVGSYDGSGDVAGRACLLAAAHLGGRGAAAIAGLPDAVAARCQTTGSVRRLVALAADRAWELGYCLVGNGMVVEAHALRVGEESVRMS